ncbi:MAG: methylmalonyl Co-A mutase-associated GTPase MeaB [Rikenellaceae bacterium]|jgi:LAO/AO transport system kinase|nr:methylmalonyl Co-A mutase-associated GTPase MeaB [Rikenellaceae bacterium]
MEHYADHHQGPRGESALKINVGIEQPPVVNPYFKKRARRMLTTDDYVEGILAGNITILSQAITLVESLLPEHYARSQEIIERCLPHTGRSVRIGITGVPGAGKSSFIEAIGNRITGLGHKLAVLAIDPSSERSGGSILGDKTRMETLVHNPDAFIRPSPSAGSLGGVARKTRETVVLCEAAGFDVIFIETVGVGQSETAVHSMVDLFLMLQISGAGDELQGIKRGIMEMADLVAVTKADGTNIDRADLTRRQFLNALSLFPMPESGWKPRVCTCSSHQKLGLTELWGGVEDFLKFTKSNGFFDKNRHRQAKYWMYETVDEALREGFYQNESVRTVLDTMERDVLENRLSSFIAARRLLDLYYESVHQEK